MHITCCDNPEHTIDNVEHHFDSSEVHMRVTASWVCMTCGARTTIDKMRLDDRRAEFLHAAITGVREHSFNTTVRQRYKYNNEIDVEDGGVATPAVRLR